MRSAGVTQLLDVFNHATGGRLVATHGWVHLGSDNTVRVTFRGLHESGRPFTYTTPPFAFGTDLAQAIDGLVRAARAYGRLTLPLHEVAALVEIRGLAERVKAVKAGIAKARAAVTELDTEATAFTTTAAEVTAQIKAAHAEIKQEAETLRNDPLPGEPPA